MNIFSATKKALENQLPFVIYRKSTTTALKAWFQKNDTLYTSENYTESGFIFTPFDNNNSAILIPETESSFFQEEIDLDIKVSQQKEFDSNNSSKKEHIELVKKGIKAISDNLFKKVVLSRKEEIKLNSFNAIETFQKLLVNYPNAFTYLWYHPKVGMWLGATPETLVKIEGAHFKTMSLAGTQVFNGTTDVTWKTKEIEEQQFVTDYINDRVSKISKGIKVSKTETIKAGNLLHLRSVIRGTINAENSTLIKALHPTPAVCGLPLEPSKKFILDNENYNRSFYTGFLGELNLTNNDQNTSELFVNLRCMEIKNNSAFVFIGGGITLDSIPENEWKETVAKTSTMRKVL
ncbi:chorismate-binding protein [Tenacibaculum aiptasiae]|uniref:chorismate-binding protein n=1 Tax=Tenacibaculum aiptasiae TaxID=426481 RepID=UPI00232FC88C|nr:chorismate-binding protein [Tenacibaculum aiptasiae]